MKPTVLQLMMIYGKRQPNEYGNAMLNVPKREIDKMGLRETDLLELSPDIYDGADGANCVFMTTGLEKACGIYRKQGRS